MCIIILNKKNSFLNNDILKNSFENNSDGAGFAYINKNNELRVIKGIFELDEFIKTYQKIKNLAISDVLIHCRISTGGKIDKLNCHPHQVHDDLVLCHNGILPIEASKTKSDTIIFIEKYLKCFDTDNLLFNNGLIQLIESYITKSNKFVLFSPKGVKIYNEDAGIYDNDGNWFSNSSYKAEKQIFKFSDWSWVKNKSSIDEMIFDYIDGLTEDEFLELGDNPCVDLLEGVLYKDCIYFDGTQKKLKKYNKELYNYYLDNYYSAIEDYKNYFNY